jgi:cupin fold WbuC family metalloprotein
VKVFSAVQLNSLVTRAVASTRLRQHQNIHASFDEPCQRLFNAIEPSSYIRPHRHASFPRDEMLIAVRGLMILVTFDDSGRVLESVPFGSEKYGADIAVGVEVSPETWHTVLALESGSVLLEIKAGPFDPEQPKDLAPWAPPEGTQEVAQFLRSLLNCVGPTRSVMTSTQTK